jgi:glutathione S-transferase
MLYELYYWPTIQGRGEFVRLALEEAAAPYRDVARETGRQAGVPAMLALLRNRALSDTPPFAPPFLTAGRTLIGQTANILQYLGPRHGLAPRDQRRRLWLHQLQLTIADFVAEIHDTHHPISGDLYFTQQRREARRRTRAFLTSRLPKFLGYFEHLPAPRGSSHLIGHRLTYVDLSMFQILEGLRFAFPRTLARTRRRYPRLFDLRARVADRPRIAAYLSSARRLPFNNEGIFRHYPELEH